MPVSSRERERFTVTRRSVLTLPGRVGGIPRLVARVDGLFPVLGRFARGVRTETPIGDLTPGETLRVTDAKLYPTRKVREEPERKIREEPSRKTREEPDRKIREEN